MGSDTLKKRLMLGGLGTALVLVALAVLFAVTTWNAVDRVSIDRSESEGAGGPVASEDENSDEDEEDGEFDTSAFEGRQIFLLVGSDSREQLDDLEDFGAFEGRRADVVMVFIRIEGRAAVLSLPRDLLVSSLCDGSNSKLALMLEGCELINGPSVLTAVVEDLIGEKVDHFAMVDLAGFQEVVDEVGGYEICVRRPVRDPLSGLDLPAGCTIADGEQTLAWLRSRMTEELTEDGWRSLPGMNDLVRNERQREFLIEMMGRLSDFSSPRDIASTASAIAPHVTVDEDISLMGAVDFAWSMKGLGSGAVEELEVPVYDDVTADGTAVLRPSEPIEDIVAQFLSPETAEALSRKSG